MWLLSEITNRWRSLSEGVWSRPSRSYLLGVLGCQRRLNSRP
jgi:hypothetical protein